MGWALLALIAALAKAANQALTKPLSRRVDVLTIAVYGQVLFAAVVFPAVLVPGVIDVPGTPEFHRAAWVTIALNVIAILLLVEAIRVSDLSYCLPFLAVTPLFTIPSGWLLRGESVSVPGLLSILAIAAGAFAIGATGARDWMSLGGRRVFGDRGTRLVLLVALLYSVSSVFDKTATLHSDAWTFTWYSALCRAVLLGLIVGVSRRSWRIRREPWGRWHAGIFLLLGATFALEAVAQMRSFEAGGTVAYVIAIKRMSILATSLAGFVIFGERFSGYRLAGALLMVAGAALLVFA